LLLYVVSGKLGLLYLFFMLSAGVGRVFLDLLGLISRPYVGLRPVRTRVEDGLLVPDVSFVSSLWILGFVFAIASAPCDFLYLNNEYII